MKTNQIKLWQLGGIAATVLSIASADNLPTDVAWGKVVNNQSVMPGTDAKPFNSYNQPSLNTAGYVVFRARAKGPQPMSGIYARNMLAPGETIRIADRTTAVPAPNNLAAEFNEFPSIPRISMTSQTMATRGVSRPVWNYLLEDGTDTRVGTTGIFLNPGGNLITGVGLLGTVPSPETPVLGENYFPYMAVPGVSPATRFDVFPGSPAVAGGDLIVFKGNYTVAGEGKTGVFYRDPIKEGGTLPVQLIANSNTVIPNLPTGVAGVPFGSTAPPSAAAGLAVFAGFDNEDSPTYGGIYLAPLIPNPTLTTLVGIGDPVPGETSATFNRFGEALSFDGRYVAFWGAWGKEPVILWLDCPTDGNKDMLAYCKEFYGDNYPVTVPANQGIFVADTKTGLVHRVARTGPDFADFVYWNFSGKPPGVGGSEEGDDGEPPRWRSTSFVAVAGGPDNTFMVAFKARSGAVDPVEHTYLSPVDGIYLADTSSVATLLDTTMDGQSLDPAAPAGSKISTLGIERESFRGSWLAITAGMVESVSEASMAGIYVSKMYSPVPLSGIRQGEYEVAPDSTEAKKSKSTSIDVKKNGEFTGKLVIGGTKYDLRGTFNRSGEARQSIRTKSGRVLVRIVAAKVSGVRVLDVTATGGGVNYNKLAVYDD